MHPRRSNQRIQRTEPIGQMADFRIVIAQNCRRNIVGDSLRFRSHLILVDNLIVKDISHLGNTLAVWRKKTFVGLAATYKRLPDNKFQVLRIYIISQILLMVAIIKRQHGAIQVAVEITESIPDSEIIYQILQIRSHRQSHDF